MNNSKTGAADQQPLSQIQQTIDEDIRKLREAQQFRTLEEKVEDMKRQGIDPAETFDSRGDEEE